MRKALESILGRRYTLADELHTIEYLRYKGYLTLKEATLFRRYAEDAAFRCIPVYN